MGLGSGQRDLKKAEAIARGGYGSSRDAKEVIMESSWQAALWFLCQCSGDLVEQ